MSVDEVQLGVRGLIQQAEADGQPDLEGDVICHWSLCFASVVNIFLFSLGECRCPSEIQLLDSLF